MYKDNPSALRFAKRDIYAEEQEYRFIFDIINLQPALINTIIFNVKSQDYIEQIIDIELNNSLLQEYCGERCIEYKKT